MKWVEFNPELIAHPQNPETGNNQPGRDINIHGGFLNFRCYKVVQEGYYHPLENVKHAATSSNRNNNRHIKNTDKNLKYVENDIKFELAGSQNQKNSTLK